MRRKIVQPGECRTRTFFAWFPVYAPSSYPTEKRWLERVTVMERGRIFSDGRGDHFCEWAVEAFIDGATGSEAVD